MGCDIHLYNEKKVKGQWVTADKGWCDEYDDGVIDVPFENRFSDRNYKLFGILAAGVRYECEYSIAVRGLPADVCPEVKTLSEYYGADGHSHSFLTLGELRDLRDTLSKNTITITGQKNRDQLRALEESIKSGRPNWDLLWPYCAWSSSPEYVDFSVNVPAAIMVGASLDEIIESLEKCDGEDQRIVFWFDN